MRRTTAIVAIAVASLFALDLLMGCSTDFTPANEPGQTALGALQGSVYGGRQAIVGAHIYVYQAGTGGYPSAGGASKSLLTAYSTGAYPTYADANGNYYELTDSTGGFTLTGEYSCTSGTQVYLYSVGGQPSPNVTNSAAGELAALGACPQSGSFADTLSFINMNEVSTVVAAYAFAGFATDPTHVSSSGSTLAQTGIQNAFLTAGNLYNIQSRPTTGFTGTALATTPNGNGTVPQKEINTIANTIAACVNSTGPSSPQCTSLFQYTKSSGTTGTQATDTAGAAINLAHNPLPTAAGVKALFNLPAKIGTPYSPALTAAPSDYTISVSYTGGGIGASGGQSPHDVAVDASGNIYTNNNGSNLLVKFSPLGVPANANGYGGNGINTPTSVAIDATSSYVWLANYGSTRVSEFTTAGAAVGNFGVGEGNLQDAQIDGSGNIWVTSDNNSALTELSSNGELLAGPTGLGGRGGQTPDARAVTAGAAGSIWTTAFDANDGYEFSNADRLTKTTANGGINAPNGVAIDATGNVWFTNNDGTVSGLTSAGAALSGSSFATGASNYVDGIAIDGDGNVWVTDTLDETVYELNNAGTNLSSTKGYVTLPATEADGIAIDGSGNVWYNSFTDAQLRELVGAAAPVVTPLAYGVKNSELGTRP
jgi:hypothetical protein